MDCSDYIPPTPTISCRESMNRYYKPCAPGENPYIDLKPYRQIVKDSDANLSESDESFSVAVVMLYGAINRLFNGNALSWHTNTKTKITRAAVRNLKSSGVWKQKGRLCKHELFTKWANSGKDMALKQVISFWMDACVANGSVVKVKNKYGLREWVNESYSKKLKQRLLTIKA
jgi:hypothetical protein